MSKNFPIRGQDQIVAGAYRLGAVVRGLSDGCIYETEYGNDRRPAVIRIAQLDPEEAERCEERWRNAINLAHPNLLRVYAAGHSVMDASPISFVVMERADESLAGVLAERALSEAETREMLIPVLGALKYLHRNGYAHSNLSPSKILAVRDVVKVAKDDVRRVGDGGTPAEDIRALGGVIVEALGLNASALEEDRGRYISPSSPHLLDIARHCLDPDPNRRWTVDQVRTSLEAHIDAPTMAPAIAEESKRRATEGPEGGRKTPKWIYAGLAALVAIVLFFGLTRKDTSTGPGAVGAATPVEQVPRATLPPIVPEASTPSLNTAPTLNNAPATKAKPSSGTRARGADGWSVIVAAYTAREPAEKRSREMAQRWPSFRWGVFEQHVGKTYYLVVIGQNLSQDQAETVRGRAVASGLPHDTYIKKLP